MLARAAKSDGKYSKIVTVFTTLVLAMSGLVLSPAHATAPIDGEYVCTTGVIKTTEETPTYTISNGVVTGGQCPGAVVIAEGVTSIGYQAFQSAVLTSITIPASVTSIEALAFNAANSLTSITIPASVTSIEEAFDGPYNLASVYFLGNAPTTDEEGFDWVADGAKAYIKSGATGFDLDTDGDGNSEVFYNLIVTIGVYTVTYNTSGGTVITAQNYVGDIPTPTSPTRTGYTFAGWSATAGGPVIAWPNSPASGSDITLYAKWTKKAAKAYAKVKPKVTGTVKVSKTLTANKGTWSGSPTPVLTYQWYACTKKVTAAKATVPSTCKKMAGATKSTLKLAKAQKGKFIAVLVTGKGSGTSATKWLSKSTAIVK